MEIHYPAESDVLSVCRVQPEGNVLEHVRVCTVGVIESRSVNEMDGIPIVLERETFDLTRAYITQSQLCRTGILRSARLK